jgi:transposase
VLPGRGPAALLLPAAGLPPPQGRAEGLQLDRLPGPDHRRQLAAPLVWVWDNLNIHLAPELAEFAEQNQAWLRIYRLPAYTPDMNPAEGIWSLLKRSMVNFAAADVDGLVRIVKRKLKKIQHRPHLIDGCLTATGLTLEPWRPHALRVHSG